MKKEPFSEKELLEINNLADLAYQDLDERREGLGFPEFDNSIPGNVRKYYDLLIGMEAYE